MKLESKYNFKDTVFPVIPVNKHDFVSCAFCGGEGNIVGKDQKSRVCPECWGRGGNNTWISRDWRVGQSLTIGQIRIETRCDHKADEDDEYAFFDNYGDQKYYKKTEYMCYETGIGSGSYWNEDRLFFTKEEAQSECDKRNSQPKEKGE